MRHYDQHVHSRFSFDSQAEPEDHVESALARGLAGLTFTEHFDTHPKEWPACVYDDESYSAAIENLRRKYDDAIIIGKGIEVCYQPEQMDFILDFLSRHEFDVVLLAVHYFGVGAVHDRQAWIGVSAGEGTRRYFETVLEAVRFCEKLHRESGPVFHVLAHLDFVKRYTRRFFARSEVSSCRDLIDEILRGCLAAGLIPEINTSTLRQGPAEPMPGVETVRRYARLGGTAMSLGSDAHHCEDVGADFDRASSILHDAGIPSTAFFKHRERVDVPLDR